MDDKLLQPKNHQLTEDFWLSEFTCKCGKCAFEADAWMDSLFMLRLQQLRDDFGRPLKITSGARCRDHNRDVGGAPRSGHLVSEGNPARAADIDVSRFSGELRYKLIKLAFRHKFRGVGVADTFLHIDLKNRFAVWTY